MTPSGTLKEGIASIPKLDRAGQFIIFGGGEARIYDANHRLIASAPLSADNTYRLQPSVLGAEEKEKEEACECVYLGSTTPTENMTLYHRRLGHRNRRSIHEAITNNLITGLDPKVKNPKSGVCPSCARAKLTKRSFKHTVTTSRPKVLTPKVKRLRKLVTDIKGPFSVAGRNEERYIMIFTCADTKFRITKALKYKSDAIEAVKAVMDIDLASEEVTVSEYHSDGAPELISRDIVQFLAKRGTRLTYSPAYTPEKNGLAERSNRTIWEMTAAMLDDSGRPADFWPEAVQHATLLTNSLPTNTIEGNMSPIQAKYGEPPNAESFRVWGCTAYVHIDASQRDSTFADKAYSGFFTGQPWPCLIAGTCTSLR